MMEKCSASLLIKVVLRHLREEKNGLFIILIIQVSRKHPTNAGRLTHRETRDKRFLHFSSIQELVENIHKGGAELGRGLDESHPSRPIRFITSRLAKLLQLETSYWWEGHCPADLCSVLWLNNGPKPKTCCPLNKAFSDPLVLLLMRKNPPFLIKPLQHPR